MLKISEAVEKILYSNEVALIALSEGYLNFSAYAQTIRKQVEIETRKPVKAGSIVVTLSRLRKSLRKQKRVADFLPDLEFEDLSVKSGLIEIAFDRTGQSLKAAEYLSKAGRWTGNDVLMVTQGTGEVSVIVSETMEKEIRLAFRGQKPKLVLGNLASLSVRFSDTYITTPNIIYAVVRHFAVHRINIIEIVSTFTELSLIVEQKNLEAGFAVLNALLQKNRTKRWSDHL